MDDPSGRILEALQFAAHKHRDQRRKGSHQAPYINHPIEVAALLATVGGVTDIVTLQAALLHDTIEDTQTTPEELQKEFGPGITSIVLEVTDNKMLKKHIRKKMQIEHAARASREAKLVKLADKLCNLRDVAERPPAKWDLARRREYFDWARQVVDGLRGVHPRLEAAFDIAYKQRPA